MSQLLIQTYLNDLSDLKRMSGSVRESVVREAFKTLLKNWGRGEDLIFVPEYEIETPDKQRRYVDGALLSEIRLPFGYWEAKDEKDNLDEEIATKFRRGYPQDNIIFEDSREAVLIQNRKEIVRADVHDPDRLGHLIKLFFEYEREEIANFRKAVDQFKTDLPKVLEALREKIEDAFRGNELFKTDAVAFLKHAQQTINPSITADDVREMLIQHILTEEIFSKVFGEDDFHRQNNVAQKLYALEQAFFTGNVKKLTLRSLEPYYAAIRASAARISSHQEKQAFLKVVYENFYKVYNKKAADRLGVVYTPNEIVRFMIESADWLTQKHFGKRLIDKGVEILDPATGTGTFITELLEHFRGQPEKLKYKYREELHANEVAILPYYVANLNIEATYAAITGEYLEYPNLCFVDTLDNIAWRQRDQVGMGDLFAAMSTENLTRVRRQNERRISVVIGNPPYNAWQENYNDRNANRSYAGVDKRIKETYAREGVAQNQMSLYDMYTRFVRWASDRIVDEGVVAFIIGRKPLSKAAYDGFRKVVEREFSDIWVMDLGGDIRDNAKLSGSTHNVFGIKVGVAIWFLVKSKDHKGPATIHYARRPERETADDKLAFLSTTALGREKFEDVQPNKKFDWVEQPTSNWDDLLPLVSKAAKQKKLGANAIFELYSRGMETHRDEWVYDSSADVLKSKVQYLVEEYEATSGGAGSGATSIKWDRELDKYLKRGVKIRFGSEKIVEAAYRPFSNEYFYWDEYLNSFQGRLAEIFDDGTQRNRCITVMGDSTGKPYFLLGVDIVPDLNFVSPGSGGTQVIPERRLVESRWKSNITDWAQDQFRARYKAAEPRKRSKSGDLSKDDIFHYVYGVLHDPIYRETFALNLKREFPRIPFYADFAQWAAWGERLMALHIGYETVAPFGLKRVDIPDTKSSTAGVPPKTLLKADKETGVIKLDSETMLTGVPEIAWTYRLGNRSALDWILDQHKEKTPKDPTIRAKFNTYRFADHKEKVVDLLDRVTRVSVETMEIVNAMKALKRD